MRECYFEYAGISSQIYNLMLCFVSSNISDFDSGGKFDLKTDTLPLSHETLLYGKDYSAQPLSFEVEFINIDDNIPLEQMIEIKNWLFGQDGWKTFKCLDERQDYSLKCIFEPGEDITDGRGYKGLRCTLKNVSPFWYGDEKEITVTQYDLQRNNHTALVGGKWYSVFSVNIADDNCVAIAVNPVITISANKTGQLGSDVKSLRLFTCDATTISDGMAVNDGAWTFPDITSVRFDISYMGDVGDSDAHDTIYVNTKYAYVESERFPTQKINIEIDPSNPLPMLTLKQGINICRVLYGWNYTSMNFRYLPVYRLGAF